MWLCFVFYGGGPRRRIERVPIGGSRQGPGMNFNLDLGCSPGPSDEDEAALVENVRFGHNAFGPNAPQAPSILGRGGPNHGSIDWNALDRWYSNGAPHNTTSISQRMDCPLALFEGFKDIDAQVMPDESFDPEIHSLWVVPHRSTPKTDTTGTPISNSSHNLWC